jgi:RNA polymerase sigma factor (sigma-70 family)
MLSTFRLHMDDPKRAGTADTASRVHLSLVTGSAAPARDASEPVLPRIAAGDERAVRECVTRYGPLIWALVRRWSPDANDAEDAVQDVFIDLWRSAAKFDSARATEAGWVAMVTRRRLIDRMRRRQRLPEMESISETFDVIDDRALDVAHAIDRASRADRARAVLQDLPSAQRRMLEMSLLEGKTHDEIARETDTPLGTVKSHIRRGLKRARDLMAGTVSDSDDEGGLS